jgi:hypothetical protein
MFEPTYGDHCKISGNGITFFIPKKHYDIEPKEDTAPDDDIFNPNFAGLLPPDDTQDKPEKHKDTINHPEIITRKTKSAITNSIYAMLWLTGCKQLFQNRVYENASKKITFATLTLPSEQNHTDTFIKKEILNHFYTELRSTFPDLLYIWRSEKQLNGNVHFHSILNKYYNCNVLQKQWNRIIEKYGYVSSYSDKFSKFSYEEYRQYVLSTRDVTNAILQKRYDTGTKENWRNPPSTQITKINNVTNVSGYLCKEMIKTNQMIQNNISVPLWKFPSAGRVFSCSQLLSQKSSFSGEIPYECADELLSLPEMLPKKVYKNDYITHISISPDLFLQFKLPKLHRFYQSFIFS